MALASPPAPQKTTTPKQPSSIFFQVGGPPCSDLQSSWWFQLTPLKNMLVKLDHFFQFLGWKHKDYLKPPTSSSFPPPRPKKKTPRANLAMFFPRNFQAKWRLHTMANRPTASTNSEYVKPRVSPRCDHNGGGGCGWWGVKGVVFCCFCLKCWLVKTTRLEAVMKK